MSGGYLLVLISMNYRNGRERSDAKKSGQTGTGIFFISYWKERVLENHDWIGRRICVESVSPKGVISMRMEETT